MNYPSRARNNKKSTAEKGFSTKARQRLFLQAFADHANVLLAARAAHINRTTVYVWLEKDEDFSFAFNQAKEDAKDVLRAEIYRRAVEGWDEPVFSAGKLAGKVRKYSDTLLIFHTKALMPEYREKQQLDVTSRIQMQRDPTLQTLTDEEIEALEAISNRITREQG